MPTLYYAPGACSLACHVVLEWIGAPYEVVRVDPSDLGFRAVNPAGAVPALRRDDGSVLVQGDAILRYIARKHPRADLLDDGTPEAAAESDRWCAFLTGDLHPAFFPVFTPQRYTTKSDAASLNAVTEAALALAAAKIALIDRHLEGRTWITGGRRTILDAYALPMLNWANRKLPEGLVPYRAAAAHFGRMLADPAVERVMDAEDTPR